MSVSKIVMIRMRVPLLVLTIWSCAFALTKESAPSPPPAETQPEIPKDTLGRATPRGAVLGFLNAARKGNGEIAALYLDTPLRGANAEALAVQLAAVLNRRLPARLNELSDKPEGSLPDPLKPDEDIVGTIDTANGPLDIMVERVDRGNRGKVWLFSRKTLESIPDAFQELSTPAVEKLLPEFLVKTKLGTIPLFEWAAVFIGLPFVYSLTGLLNRGLTWAVGKLRRRLLPKSDSQNFEILPPPFRLLLLAVVIRWLLSRVGLSLLARQFWTHAAFVIAIIACMWLLIRLNGWGERYFIKRRSRLSGSASVARFVRRVIDGVVLFSGLLFTLHHFGVNPTAAVAGLGVGGIAVALAAQKTLENVIAGISLIADEAVRVGDFLKLGEIQGTVEQVGLRSTRIRTPDRTIISLPNGQIANISLETISARDKYWFHPLLGLRYETTPAQLRSVLAGVRNLLVEHPSVDSSSVRVTFISMGESSINVDISSYIFANDWNGFLAIQEELLMGAMDVVEKAGTQFAFPSQTLYLKSDSANDQLQVSTDDNGRRGAVREIGRNIRR
jgi:MscS family membrane protein